MIAGIATFFFGFALIYWTRDRSSNVSGPLLGAALLSLLIAVGGWAYEDGRMKKKAEQGGHGPGARLARFTQVLTFAVPEGRIDAALASGGIIPAIEASDSTLRDLAGFQDLRIIASPTAAGPSQVLVETTWSNREGLATYEETRQTMLDLVAAHPDDVAPGSVQVFDMDVVRDTKDVSFRFSTGAAAAVIGALAIGGFAIGSGITLFQDTTPVASVPGGATAPAGGGGFNGTIVAKTATKFETAAFSLPPATDVTLTFDNQDQGIPHNIHFFASQDAGGQSLTTCKTGCATPPEVSTAVKAGPEKESFTFTTPAAGKYLFHCDVHPDTMKGTLTVEAGAPVPGAAPAAGGGAAPAGGGAAGAGAVTVIATDNKFDKTEIDAPAATAFTVEFKNNGKVKHNLHFYDKQGGKTLADGAGSDSTFVDGGKSETLKFTTPAAGTYYFECDLHPDQMNGKFVVK
jgi:plastocyanin